MDLHTLKNGSKPSKRRKRVGRGIGSNMGKTSCRGHKGAGSRAGAKSRARYEGGQVPLYRKMPVRGFTRGRFLKRVDIVNFDNIEQLYNDGEVVNLETLRARGFLKGHSYGVKLLSHGELTKKVSFEVQGISKGAQAKLEELQLSYKVEPLKKKAQPE